jgi:hypothetical protein
MNASMSLVHDAFGVVIAIAVPMLAAALAGVLVAGVLGRLMGVGDASGAAVVRAAAMLVAIAVLGAAWADEVRGFAATSWATLATAGGQGP